MAVARSARKQTRSESEKQRLSLLQERQKLVEAIIQFHTDASKYVPELQQVARDSTDLGKEWDGDNDSEPGAAEQEADTTSSEDLQDLLDIDRHAPEHQGIALPSNIGWSYLAQHNLQHLATQQRKLEVGVMNDALQRIRVGIGYKSLLYRTKVRGARGVRDRLRSFDEIHTTEEGVKRHVRIYMRARSALPKLYNPKCDKDLTALSDLLDKYKPIRREDLRAETTLVESFMSGQRDKHASWLWHFEDDIGGSSGQFILNSESF